MSTSTTTRRQASTTTTTTSSNRRQRWSSSFLLGSSLLCACTSTSHAFLLSPPTSTYTATRPSSSSSSSFSLPSTTTTTTTSTIGRRRRFPSSPSPLFVAPDSSSSSSPQAQADTPITSTSTPPLSTPDDLKYEKKYTGKEVTFQASKGAEWEVTEGVRPLKDYMALPPSQYSVLDADAVVRLSEDSFRCQIGGINFFGYKFVPILYLKVLVDPVAGKSTLNIYKIDLTGSRIAEFANGTFQVKARNVVSYRKTDSSERKVLMSTVSVHVDAQVPRGNIIPLHVLEKGGSSVIYGILKLMVPRFVKILAKDYENWSTGDDSRSAVAQEVGETLTTPDA